MPDQKTFKVVINVAKDSSVEIVQWPLLPYEQKTESDRISVEWEGLNYAIIMDNERPRVEIRNLDSHGEVKDVVAHVPLPNFKLKRTCLHPQPAVA